MPEKESHDFKSAFDDRSLPINDLSAERIEEIEKIVMPELFSNLEKLRQEKPHLFKDAIKKLRNKL